MDAKLIKRDNRLFRRHFPAVLPAMGWYFSVHRPDDAIELSPTRRTCIFAYIKAVVKGNALCFSDGFTGCPGAACYLGYTRPGKNAGRFLWSQEKFKMSAFHGQAFYRRIKTESPHEPYMILERLDQVRDDADVEVVNYWVHAQTLAGLVTLANYDRLRNDNAEIPFASGCQSMWTLPFGERNRMHPRAIVGAMDPAMRRHVDQNVMLFSVPAMRFHQMAANIPNSFANGDHWLNLIDCHLTMA